MLLYNVKRTLLEVLLEWLVRWVPGCFVLVMDLAHSGFGWFSYFDCSGLFLSKSYVGGGGISCWSYGFACWMWFLEVVGGRLDTNIQRLVGTASYLPKSHLRHSVFSLLTRKLLSSSASLQISSLLFNPFADSAINTISSANICTKGMFSESLAKAHPILSKRYMGHNGLNFE
ncbi:hypothetical protein Tco_0796343 [Tanacetum coccineum]